VVRVVRSLVVLTGLAVSLASCAWAHDLRLMIPERGVLSPVQRLNRDGVQAVRHHQYEKAEALFYKAYLYDPSDPFTLNNLGYISELQGKLSRAEKFYKLAAEQGSSATIAMSNADALKGKPMMDAVTGLADVPMQVNRLNVQAIDLLGQNRYFEAATVLDKALKLQPENPFTLNNLAVAEEGTGDYQDALAHYRQAASSRSTEPVVVTLDRSWRGKPVSEMAAASAKRLERHIRSVGEERAQAAMLTWRGVAALNANDSRAAAADFRKAYTLQPDSAFTLNNIGYVSELDGDVETAQFFYGRATQAAGAGSRVGLATDTGSQGLRASRVAAANQQAMSTALEQYRRRARQQTGPVELIPRGSLTQPSQPKQQTGGKAATNTTGATVPETH
jgi:Flp pilus assembly protein TadD